jgi:hypothetical protein
MIFRANHDSSAGVEEEEKEEQEDKEGEVERTVGQLRDRQGLASARAAVPGPRARRVHSDVEDITIGEVTDGAGEGEEDGGVAHVPEAYGGRGAAGAGAPRRSTPADTLDWGTRGRRSDIAAGDVVPAAPAPSRDRGGGLFGVSGRHGIPPAGDAVEVTEEQQEQAEEEEEEVEEEDEDEADEEAAPRALREDESGAGLTGGSETVRLQSLPPGARLEPGSPRVRLRAPGRVAGNAIKYDDVHEQEKKEEVGFDPLLRKHGGGGPAGTSRYKGVCWDKSTNKWLARCDEKRLGLHTTEEAAARAYSKYLEDGIAPELPASSSQFKGITWDKTSKKWKAQCNRTHLGNHATEEHAARAYGNYLKDGIDPVSRSRRETSTSQFTGVSWDKPGLKWRADCKGNYRGLHTTEEAAVRAYSKYLEDGVVPERAERGEWGRGLHSSTSQLNLSCF